MTTEPLSMSLGKGLPLVEARFIERPNQFTLVVSLNGQHVRAAMADRGRLKTVLTPGRIILLEHRPEKHRKTAYQVVAAQMDGGGLVSLDTTLPNRLVARALAARAIPELPAYTGWKAEQTVGGSRFDFCLHLEDGARMLLEVKSVARIDPDGVARFPDAPTTRGVRHLQELAHLHRDPKTRCAVLFIVQGESARRFEVDVETDPHFQDALVAAHQAGVQLLARRCALRRTGLWWGQPCPINLAPIP
ncbi:MAG: DNA/RNA nuclease SfsA [Myxococcota bacterium]